MSRSFKRLCEKEGLPDVRLHDLRHFVATQLLSAGVDVRTVAGRLGHRNAATTLNVYAHFVEQTDRAAADIMGGVLRRWCVGGVLAFSPRHRVVWPEAIGRVQQPVDDDRRYDDASPEPSCLNVAASTHSYAVVREMPRMRATSSTV